jgi:hypothetical protein
MSLLSYSVLGTLCISLAALTGGCSGADRASEVAALEAADNAKVIVLHGDVEVRLERIGNPKWEPVDFHHFSAPWDALPQIAADLLPEPEHTEHPDLGIGPGAAHAAPYDQELASMVSSLGYTDSSTFAVAEFTEGVVLAWMTVPRNSGSPKGSSPDFANGSIIPNELFPIHVEIQYFKDGVSDGFVMAVDVLPLDQSLNPSFDVDGHSHFPMFNSDSGVFYGTPTEGSYLWTIQMTDTQGDGWHIEVPYEVQ